jgi:Plasmid stabilization system protein
MHSGSNVDMDRYIVKITAKALNDMREIYEYIADDLNSPMAAMHQYDGIAAAVESLDVFPERIKVMESEPEHAIMLRKMDIDNYAVLFVIEDTTVIVTNVFYGASDISRKLAELD